MGPDQGGADHAAHARADPGRVEGGDEGVELGPRAEAHVGGEGREQLPLEEGAHALASHPLEELAGVHAERQGVVALVPARRPRGGLPLDRLPDPLGAPRAGAVLQGERRVEVGQTGAVGQQGARGDPALPARANSGQ